MADMEFSWGLLETTMEKASDVLGNNISEINIEQEMMDQVISNGFDIPMDVINNDMLASERLYNCDNLELEATENATEDLPPQSRERSNTWPKRQLGPGLVDKLECQLKEIYY